MCTPVFLRIHLGRLHNGKLSIVEAHEGIVVK